MPGMKARAAIMSDFWKFEDSEFAAFQTVIQGATWITDWNGQYPNATVTVERGEGDTGAVVTFTNANPDFPSTYEIEIANGDYFQGYSGGMIWAAAAMPATQFGPNFVVLAQDNPE